MLIGDNFYSRITFFGRSRDQFNCSEIIGTSWWRFKIENWKLLIAQDENLVDNRVYIFVDKLDPFTSRGIFKPFRSQAASDDKSLGIVARTLFASAADGEYSSWLLFMSDMDHVSREFKLDSLYGTSTMMGS